MGARLLVLGLDGATWQLLDPLAARLPNLRRLWTTGARAPLTSTTPPMTLPAWSTILSGVGPGTHGLLDFTRRVPGTYRVELLNATHRRVPLLPWLASARGGRAASVAVPGTWPPEPLDGVVVAGFDSPVATSVEALHCQPRALYRELRRFGGLRFADFQEGEIGPGWHEHALAALLREVGRKEAVCRHLLDREEWEAFVVVFGESDTAAHHFWMFHDAASPRHRDRLRGALTAVYERLDAAVGVLAARGEHVCVVSDHGFGGAGDLAIYLNRFLEEHGWLAFREGGPDARTVAARQAAMRLPVERIVRRLPPALLGRAESRARYGGIDFAATRAWSDEMNYAATIHLNVRGRDPAGTIDDVDAATADLTRALLAWRVDGHPVVDRVIPRRDAFPGAAADGAPDLVLELHLPGGYSYAVLPSARVPAGTTWRRLEPHEHVGGKGLGPNGSHRPEGVLMLNGPAFRRGARLCAGVADVLPTLLTAVGEPVPAYVEGRVLVESLVASPASPSLSPSGSRSTSPPGPAFPASPPSRPTPPAEARRLRERLERLGYL